MIYGCCAERGKRNWSTNLAGRDETSRDRYRKTFRLRLNETKARKIRSYSSSRFHLKDLSGVAADPGRGVGGGRGKCVLMKHGWELGTRAAHKLSALSLSLSLDSLHGNDIRNICSSFIHQTLSHGALKIGF